MPTLLVVNPTPTKRRKSTGRRKTATTKATGRKAAKGTVMAKRRRSAAQRAATAKMLAANRRKRHHNPAPARKRRYHAAATRRVTHRRRHRNPSATGTGNLFRELMSKDGLMSIAAVVATPTISELAISYFAPTLRGYTRTAAKAAIGVGLAYVVHRFVNKKAGVITGLVAVGAAAAEAIQVYQGNSFVGPPVLGPIKGYGPVGMGAIPAIRLAPNTPRRPAAVGMHGYAATANQRSMAIEPGTYVPLT